jgi:hypothetical protein
MHNSGSLYISAGVDLVPGAASVTKSNGSSLISQSGAINLELRLKPSQSLDSFELLLTSLRLNELKNSAIFGQSYWGLNVFESHIKIENDKEILFCAPSGCSRTFIIKETNSETGVSKLVNQLGEEVGFMSPTKSEIHYRQISASYYFDKYRLTAFEASGAKYQIKYDSEHWELLKNAVSFLTVKKKSTNFLVKNLDVEYDISVDSINKINYIKEIKSLEKKIKVDIKSDDKNIFLLFDDKVKKVSLSFAHNTAILKKFNDINYDIVLDEENTVKFCTLKSQDDKIIEHNSYDFKNRIFETTDPKGFRVKTEIYLSGLWTGLKKSVKYYDAEEVITEEVLFEYNEYNYPNKVSSKKFGTTSVIDYAGSTNYILSYSNNGKMRYKNNKNGNGYIIIENAFNDKETKDVKLEFNRIKLGTYEFINTENNKKTIVPRDELADFFASLFPLYFIENYSF